MFFFVQLNSIYSKEYSIVFVHIGDSVPEYSKTALMQAAYFNEDNKIFFLLNTRAVEIAKGWDLPRNIILVNFDEIPKTRAHKLFISKIIDNTIFHENFWRYTTERFFYLHDFIQSNPHKNIFHLEYDNMLYRDLSEILSVFELNYKNKVGLTLDADNRAIAGFVYFNTPRCLELLVAFLLKIINQQKNDMEALAQFTRKFPEAAQALPVIFKEYTNHYELMNLLTVKMQDPHKYTTCIDEFNSIFDAAAIGQYLGGIDPKIDPKGNYLSKFVNETCCFDCSKMEYNWGFDSKGRVVPLVSLNGNSYRINNLHIHSKKLQDFASELLVCP